MDNLELDNYNAIRAGGEGFREEPRGLIAVWGKEAVQFLDGMITNDMKTLEDGAEMLAAFPNAQGRLLAVVRVLRQGDKFLIETEEATREKVFNNLFRFTFAGEFFVEDLSGKYKYFEMFNAKPSIEEGFYFETGRKYGAFVQAESADAFRKEIADAGGGAINDELYETLRIENGVPLYGVDMDETTIVPEIGLDGLISYNKGCYVGQEIIARIHFRGHVAKRLAGLIMPDASTPISSADAGGPDLSKDGKNAGRTTSVTFSPKLGRNIALAYVRYEFFEPGTKLESPMGTATVTELPFI